jgi:hypothetical protein
MNIEAGDCKFLPEDAACIYFPSSNHRLLPPAMGGGLPPPLSFKGEILVAVWGGAQWEPPPQQTTKAQYVFLYIPP